MATAKTLKTVSAETAGDWRRWLERHHASEAEVWLVFHKRRLDAERYARKFTPRRADSRWSAVNRRHYERLKAAGRITRAGLDRAPGERRSEPPAQASRAVPRYIEDALSRHAAARRSFEALPPSHRRQYILWIDSAKQDETKRRRLEKAVRMLTAGERLF